jgi:hypothetical protein
MNGGPSNRASTTIISPARLEAEQCFKSFKNMLREILKLQATSGISGRKINPPMANPIARQLRDLKILATLAINMN